MTDDGHAVAPSVLWLKPLPKQCVGVYDRFIEEDRVTDDVHAEALSEQTLRLLGFRWKVQEINLPIVRHERNLFPVRRECS